MNGECVLLVLHALYTEEHFHLPGTVSLSNVCVCRLVFRSWSHGIHLSCTNTSCCMQELLNLILKALTLLYGNPIK